MHAIHTCVGSLFAAISLLRFFILRKPSVIVTNSNSEVQLNCDLHWEPVCGLQQSGYLIMYAAKNQSNSLGGYRVLRKLVMN